ncbi:MAG TPA: hypothetical protein VEI03_19960 [Stellaceae bacterium]|nr:hypothetical protein [Stellaceae bacterium]
MRPLLSAAAAGMLALLSVGTVCLARPPENADPAFAPWFQSLRAPDGGLCCSEADCRPVEYRISGDHYEVLIGKQYGDDVLPHWEEVPADSVLSKTDNPTGRAIACWLPYTNPKVLCFVRPAET